MVPVMRKGFGLLLLFALCGQAWSAGNNPPTVSLTAPAANAIFSAGANIVLSANAADSDGTVSKVDFYRGGTTLIGTATTSPYTVTWTSAPAGSYSLTAKATDNKGAVTTSAAVSISVISNLPPTVTLTAPSNGTSFAAGSNITLGANASDSDGTVASVAFYNGLTLIGTATSAPYTIAWTNIAAGTYALTAKATDNKGATTTSSTATITVVSSPLVVVTSPAWQARTMRRSSESPSMRAAVLMRPGRLPRSIFRLPPMHFRSQKEALARPVSRSLAMAQSPTVTGPTDSSPNWRPTVVH